MSSYGSNHSGYLHPSHYPPPNQHQQQPPPYPTTPGTAPPQSQPQAYFPPTPQQQLQQLTNAFSTSPTQQFQQPFYSSSPTTQSHQPIYSTSPTTTTYPPAPTHRRSSSSASSSQFQFQRPHPHFTPSAPIIIPERTSRPPIYARDTGSHGSHHSTHMHDPHAFADGEDKYAEEERHGHGHGYGGLDAETLRQYEKRYAKDRELEKRPTLGGSVMSAVRALGGKR